MQAMQEREAGAAGPVGRPIPALERASHMQLEVERLTSEPRRFAYEEGNAWWCALMPPAIGLPRELAEPLAVTGQAYRGHGEEIVLEGSIEGGSSSNAHAASPAIVTPLREPFRLRPGARRSARAGGSRGRRGAGPRRLVLVGRARDGLVPGARDRAGSVCLEMISLALPVQPLCREDCAGSVRAAAPTATRRRAAASESGPSSPFAVLAALRRGTPERDEGGD